MFVAQAEETHEQAILPGTRSEGFAATHRRIQAPSSKSVAGDYAEHQGFRHRGHGDLPARHAPVHDHGSQRSIFVRSQGPLRPEQSKSSRVGKPDVEISAALAAGTPGREVAPDGARF